MYLSQFFIEDLGHASDLIASDQPKEAAVVNPGREIQPYLDRARRAGVTIHAAREAHLHDDVVSGAKHLAARVGAGHLAPTKADLTDTYRTVRVGDGLRIGEVRFRVHFTPGHTPEHACYVVADTARAEAPSLFAPRLNVRAGVIACG